MKLADVHSGMLVRWSKPTVQLLGGEYGGTFTARIVDSNGWGGFCGEVVDPGDYFDSDAGRLVAGQLLPNLRPELLEIQEES